MSNHAVSIQPIETSRSACGGFSLVAPTIKTERMTLRMPTIEDAEPYIAVLMSERASHIGGPMSREDAWYDYCAEVASWALRGYGGFTMEDENGTFLGLLIVHHDDGDPEREIGWILTEEAEGKGYAYEAALAVRTWAFDTFGWPDLVSYIAPENAASVALAQRLGAVRDDAAPRVPSYPNCLIFRHTNPEVSS